MSSKQNRIPLFCVVTSLYWFSLYAFVPTLSTYAESLSSSHKMVGLILGSYGFTQMILRIPLGILSDTLNRRKVFITIGIVLAVISSLGMWCFPNSFMLLLFRSLTGAAAAAWVTYTVLFSSYFDGEHAPKAIGYISSFNSLGQMTAMLLGGTAAQFFGEKSPFLLATAAGLIGILLSLGVVEKRNMQREPLKVPELLKVAKDGSLLMVSGFAILAQLLTFSTVYGFTPVAAKEIGASPFELGLLTTLSTLPGIFAAPLSGTFFASRFGERRTIVSGFLLIAFSCIVVPFIHDMNLLYASQFVGGFGRGIVFPMLMGLSIKTVKDEKRATAMGFFQAIYGLGMFAGPVLTGFMSDMLGLEWGFVITAIIGVITAVLAGVFIKDNSRLKESQENRRRFLN